VRRRVEGKEEGWKVIPFVNYFFTVTRLKPSKCGILLVNGADIESCLLSVKGILLLHFFLHLFLPSLRFLSFFLFSFASILFFFSIFCTMADDATLPKATVAKVIKDMLPKDVKCANDTKDLILECCVGKEMPLLLLHPHRHRHPLLHPLAFPFPHRHPLLLFSSSSSSSSFLFLFHIRPRPHHFLFLLILFPLPHPLPLPLSLPLPVLLGSLLFLPEFIHLISSEANEVCNTENKRTITPEHVLKALQDLGFAQYADDVTQTYDKHRTEASVCCPYPLLLLLLLLLLIVTSFFHKQQKKPRGGRKLEKLGIPEEQLLQEQQQLFAKARIALSQSSDAISLSSSSNSIP
jgi:histone H3/H4